MKRWSLVALILARLVHADVVPAFETLQLEIPITPFSNMASGYQATNPGFKAVIRSEAGHFIAGGSLTMDAVMKGVTDDASRGSAYGRLILKVDIEDSYPGIASGVMQGKYQGILSICMAQDPKADIQDTVCKNLSGNIHPERPFQWLDKKIEFEVRDSNIRITRFFGSVGDGGTPEQLSLAVFHPAYGFAAPGKAFKDYQSPLVLDLDRNGKLDLVNVWDEAPAIRFDLNGSGKLVRTGWVKPTDGFLFMDDGTGCVHNGTQLFGEYTAAKSNEKSFENGFAALASTLKVGDTKTIAVSKFPKLKVWRDLSQDGICQKGEVAPAARWMKSLSLDYQTIENPTLTEDNEIRLTGKYTARDGKEYLLGDVWFKQRRNETAAK